MYQIEQSIFSKDFADVKIFRLGAIAMSKFSGRGVPYALYSWRNRCTDGRGNASLPVFVVPLKPLLGIW